MDIREMNESDFVNCYFHLFAEVQLGAHYNPERSSHVDWVRKQIEKLFFQQNDVFSLTSEADEPLGFACIYVEEPLEGVPCMGHYSELLDIAVFSSHRGKNYGSMLLNFSENFAKERGAHCLYMSTYSKDHSVISFYGKNGFIPIATLPDVYGPDDEGKIWMRKVLSS